MDVPVRDAAGREVDPVAADDPVGRGVELDLREQRSAGVVAAELPDERGPSTRARPNDASFRSTS